MPPGLQRRFGAKGSNQYQTKPGGSGPTVDPQRAAAVKDAVETESVAWAFDPDAHLPPHRARWVAAALDGEDRYVRRAAHSDPEVRKDLAAARDCPVEVLVVLADDDHSAVRYSAIANRRCPVDVLAAHTDRDPAAVAANPNCPPELLVKMVEENNTTRALLDHPNCPPAIFDRAVAQLAGPTDEASLSHSESTRRTAAADPVISQERLAYMAYNDTQTVWLGVVLNPTATPSMLRHLAEHGELRVRRGVAGHPNTPLDLLERLTRDHSSEVARRAKMMIENRKGK